MQKLMLCLLFLIFPFILNAQWIQTSLNPGIGYTLFSNDTTIYAGTNHGLYYTNDIGNPWFSIGPDDWISSVITAGNNIVAGSGSSKGIWISSDLGQIWSHPSGIDNQSVDALCKNNSYLFAGTWGNGVYRSGDSGLSWQKVGLADEPVEAVFSLGNTIFAGGADINGAKVYFSADNGTTWDYRYLPYPAASRIYCLEYKDGKVFAGTDGGLYSSGDSGNNWSLEYGATFDSLGNVTDTKMFKSLIVYDQYLVASIMFNGIWVSSDNGKEWKSFNEGLIPDWSFNGLAIKSDNLWSLRESFGNAYLRPLSDLITGIQNEEKTMPSEYALYQNYPNPFNPTTTISYSIPKQSYVTLKVFDVLGREITTLVNKGKTAGSYKVEFNASSVSRRITSGIYFYRIQAGDFVDTKKLILLK